MAEMDVLLEQWKGLSAYQVAVKNGYVGTEQQWLASLHGADGTIITVNGEQAGEDNNISLDADDIPFDATHSVEDVLSPLVNAISASSTAVDIGGRYLDNALFR